MEWRSEIMKTKRLVTAAAGMGVAVGLCGPASAVTFEYEAFGGVRDLAGTHESYGFDGTYTWWENFAPWNLPRDSRHSLNQSTDDGDDAWPGVSWGTDSNDQTGPFAPQTGLVTLPAAGTVDADDANGAEFGALVHFNNSIRFSSPGEGPEYGNDFDIAWALRVKDPDNPGAFLVDEEFTFRLHQWETLNSPAGNYPDGDCPRSRPDLNPWLVTPGDPDHEFYADGNEVGGDRGCDDAFGFDPLNGAGPLTTFKYGCANYGVTVMGFYEATMDGGGVITCSTVPHPEDSFWSPEEADSETCVRFRIDTIPPEDVYVDIKPTSCPNPVNANLNPRSNAVLPAAILGTASLDTTEIVGNTVEICRDGYGCVPVLRYNHAYAAAPYTGEACLDRDSCTTENDDIIDLAVKFHYNTVLDTLGLRGAAPDETFCLTIRAELQDGTEVEGQDVIWINRASGSSSSSSRR
jgi:hypothetical protein